jgi:rhodanese-related sulfurtransferase
MPRRPLLAGSLAGRTLALLLVSVALGAAANLVSPRAIPWQQDWSNYVANKAGETGIRVVTLEETLQIVNEGPQHFIFDARRLEDYDQGQIPGAMPWPYLELEEYYPQYQGLLLVGDPVLVYCSGEECDESLLLAEFLLEQGHTNVVLFTGGYRAWEKATQDVNP